MRVRPVLAWYDLWLGFFWHRRKKTLYVMVLPCVGFRLEFGR